MEDQVYYAHRSGIEPIRGIYRSKLVAHIDASPHSSVFPVQVTEAPEAKATHWGWLATGETSYSHIYPREIELRMCFTYGVETEIQAGKGRIVRLLVQEISE